jgi:hypothetical protein
MSIHSYFGDVVGHVIYDMHVEVVGRGLKLLCKCLANEERYAGSIHLDAAQQAESLRLNRRDESHMYY